MKMLLQLQDVQHLHIRPIVLLPVAVVLPLYCWQQYTPTSYCCTAIAKMLAVDQLYS